MKIVTFNVLHFKNYKTGEIDFSKFAGEIKNSGADITGLNEVRGKGLLKDYTDQLKTISELTGQKYYFGKAISVKGLAPYGNGLLSKYDITDAKTVKIPDPDKKTGSEMYESRSIIKARIRDLTIIVTHMGLNTDERENAVKTILGIAPEERCIIMGDFNCTPDAPELSDLFGKFICSDKDAFTFPSDKPQKKIDYIFVSKDIKIKSFGTSENVVSDHLYHYIEIEE